MANEFGKVLWEEVGPCGEARQYEFFPQTLDQEATLAVYELIARPRQHPAWDRYMLGLIHLRPIPGSEHPVEIREENATHEVMVLALSPDYPTQMADGGPLRHLTPANVVAQVSVPLDDNVRADKIMRDVVRLAAKGFVRGYPMVEDPGNWLGANKRLTEEWRRCIYLTMEHEILGGHG